MNFTPNEISEISDDLIINDNIGNRDNPYDWIDILGLTQRPESVERALFFATHADGTDGWHNAFDRRPYAYDVAKSKGWDLAIDSRSEFHDIPHLQATSLEQLAERLYQESKSRTNPYIVGVTGSVGKTTTIAFHEHLLREAGLPVVRFWSKRLTPLLVQTHYINRVDEGTGFVVMEYSAYGQEHVANLASVLPPNVAFLTNIYDTHINPGQFSSRKDIFDSKIGIRADSSIGYMNKSVLSDLGLDIPVGWTPFSVDSELIVNNPYLPPTLRTAELQTTGRLLARDLGISDEVFERALKSFKPQERRVITVELDSGSTVFFDGEATYGSRQISWFETLDGSSPTMMIEEVNFGSEDLDGQHGLLKKLFESECTYVLDIKENRSRIPSNVSVKYLSATEFADRFRSKLGSYLVYHKALSTRDPKFNPESYLKSRF